MQNIIAHRKTFIRAHSIINTYPHMSTETRSLEERNVEPCDVVVHLFIFALVL